MAIAKGVAYLSGKKDGALVKLCPYGLEFPLGQIHIPEPEKNIIALS